MKIGLIGVGLLGQAITERLIAAQFKVLGYDIAAKLDAFAEAGGIRCDSVADIARQCDRILLCLPDSSVVQTIAIELTPHFRQHTLLDTTTGSPQDSIQLGDHLQQLGVAYLDATVAGSSQQMRDKQATIMVGGTAESFAKCRDIFDAISKKTYRLGEIGSGSQMKLVVNLAIGLNRAVLAEAMAFGESLGFDSHQILEVLRNTPAHSAAMDTKGEKMANSDFEPQARLRQHLKDVKLILELANAKHAKVPLSQFHETLLEQLVAAGFSELDNSAIIQAFRGDN